MLSHIQQEITDWSYAPCLKAQSKDKVTEILILTGDDHYLLAFFAYDTQRKLIVLSFKGTVCGNNYINGLIDFTAIPPSPTPA